MAFHNRSNCGYHFPIKELVKEFEKEFNRLGENTEKCKIFSVSITKECKKVDKNGKETTRTICCMLQFTGSSRFMESSLSSLNMDMIIKTLKREELNTKIVSATLNTEVLKMI